MCKKRHLSMSTLTRTRITNLGELKSQNHLKLNRQAWILKCCPTRVHSRRKVTRGKQKSNLRKIIVEQWNISLWKFQPWKLLKRRNFPKIQTSSFEWMLSIRPFLPKKSNKCRRITSLSSFLQIRKWRPRKTKDKMPQAINSTKKCVVHQLVAICFQAMKLQTQLPNKTTNCNQICNSSKEWLLSRSRKQHRIY